MMRGRWNRRQVLSAAGALSVVPIFARAEERRMISRNIPSSDEELPVIDLMQVHNLRDTDIHMQTVREWQESGRIRYSGLTHYTASALDRLEAAMKKHNPDFIQINYSLGEMEADRRLLPMARDMGIAVLINRPYQGGRLFRTVSGQSLPTWAKSFASSWGQFFLKFIVSHPAVSCAIPATSKPHHMADNLEAGFGALPDKATRQGMIQFMQSV
jgi:aryl-alcohol dehydrogenase-like predicted oxidoreductase